MPDVDGRFLVLQFGHAERPRTEVQQRHAGGFQPESLIVGKRDPANVGAISGLLWFDIREPEIIDFVLVDADRGAEIAVPVVLLRPAPVPLHVSQRA